MGTACNLHLAGTGKSFSAPDDQSPLDTIASSPASSLASATALLSLLQHTHSRGSRKVRGCVARCRRRRRCRAACRQAAPRCRPPAYDDSDRPCFAPQGMEEPVTLPPNIEDVPPPGLALVEELDKLLLVQVL